MASVYLSRSELESLPAGGFVWGCCFPGGVRFDYVYGPPGDYLAVARHPRVGDLLHKGVCRSLAEARGLAQARAAELGVFYADIGAVRALPALDYLAELDRLP